MNGLDNCITIFDKFTAKYKSEESYFPRAKGTYISPANVLSVMSPTNKTRVGQMQYLLIGSYSIAQVFDLYITELSKQFKEIHSFALSRLVVKAIKHGKCHILADTLMNKFFKKGIQNVEIHFLEDTRGVSTADHCFLTVDIKDKGTYVFDPFFKIACPYSEFLNRPEIVSYFEARSGITPWKAQDCKQTVMKYTHTIYKKYLDIFTTQMNAGKKLNDTAASNLEKLKQKLNFLKSLSEQNFDANTVEIMNLFTSINMNAFHPSLIGPDRIMLTPKPSNYQEQSTNKTKDPLEVKRTLITTAWKSFSFQFNMLFNLDSLKLEWKSHTPTQGPLSGHEIWYLNIPIDKKELALLVNEFMKQLKFSSNIMETAKSKSPSVVVDLTLSTGPI